MSEPLPTYWTRHMAFGFVACRDGLGCKYCGRDLDEKHVTLDHVDPKQRGWHPDNIVIACRSCNSRKNARTPQEWVDAEHEKALFDNHLYEIATDTHGHDIEALRKAVAALVKYPGMYEWLYRERKWEAYK